MFLIFIAIYEYIIKILFDKRRIALIGKLGKIISNIGITFYSIIHILIISLILNDHLNIFYDYDFEKIQSIGTFIAPLLTVGTIAFLYINFIYETRKNTETSINQKKEKSLQLWRETTIKVIDIFNNKIDKLEVTIGKEKSYYGKDVLSYYKNNLENKFNEADTKYTPVGIFALPFKGYHILDECLKIVKMIEESPTGRIEIEYNYLKNYFLLVIPDELPYFILQIFKCCSKNYDKITKKDYLLLYDFFAEFNDRTFIVEEQQKLEKVELERIKR